jgi:acyl-coenzyme A thioesterase PaaI-like protein
MSLTAQQLGDVIRAGVPMAQDIGFTVDDAGEGFAKARLIFSDRLIRSDSPGAVRCCRSPA